MSEKRSARGMSAIPGRVLKSLLLASALVCATAPTPVGRAVALRPAAALQVEDTGGVGVIAFEAGGEIYVVGVDGGTPTKIVPRKADSVNMQPALSPDGSRVAFSSNREGRFHIYVVGVDGEGMRLLTNGPDHDSEPAWSPDGSRIAFARGFDATGNGVFVQTCAEASDILVVEVDAEEPVEVNLTNGAHGTDPAWSPDGKRIAFASDRAGNFDIYIMSSGDGGDVKQLTQDEWAEADPAWSPDGSQIAYTAGLRMGGSTGCGTMPVGGVPTGGGTGGVLGGGDPYIYKMAADGSWRKEVTKVGGAAGPAWSPDGTRIVFAGGLKAEADVQLYSVPSSPAGERWTQLTFDATPKSSPSWACAVVR